MLGGSVTGTGTVVGGLVGSNSGGTISNAYVTGSVSSIATFIITDTDPDSVEGAIVGGLVGDNYGTISNAYSTGAVSSILRVIGADPALGPRAISSAGGIAGINGGIINNVYATGTVSTTVSGASVQNALGGLVGNNYCGSLTDVYATGNVSATGNGNGFYVGGLVGSNIMGNITNARATGAVLLRDDQGAVGGLVGINQNATISNTYATGTVSAVGENNYVGGLVGDNEQYSNENSTVITDSYATGAISAGDKGTVGGLVGMTDSTSSISNAYATGAISAGTDSLVGGLIGSNNGAVTNAYWDTTTTGVAQAVGDGSSMGITGLTTVQWLLGGADSLIELPAWVAGAPYPVLSALPYIVIKAEGAQVYGSNGLNISGVTFTDQNGAEASSRMSGAIAWQNVILSSTNSAGSTGILYGTGMTASGYQIVYRALNTITPAELIVMAANQSGTYGQSPVLDNAAFAVSGIVNGDKVTGVTLATDAKAESPAGLYALTISKAIGTGLGNYSISYRPALYEVEASASVAPEPVPSTPDTSMTIVPEPVPSVPDTSTAVVPEPVPPVPDTLMPVSPIPTTPILTPAAAAVAFSQVFWPTPVTSPTSVSFSSPVLSSMQTSDESDEADESENVASVASLKAMYAKNQMLGAEGGLAYRIISLLPALSNQLRKIQ
ncbi:GLUG motif-containing protein [Asaia astilbis]|uniref:GLUG motif-containing protein n=1 Tax=Asaia astilbis TaxID=610244 RepID=UPI0004704F54|nr:GLUG motif-containing protein [Asaia astilbis]